MQPSVAAVPSGALLGREGRPAPAAATPRLVLAVVATDQQRLRAALRRVAVAPALLAATVRVVVVDPGTTPAASVLREAVRLPAGLLRVVRPIGADRAEALAVLLLAATAEAGADAVLVLDDAALTDPAVLLAAAEAAARTPGSEVVGLRDPAAGDAPGAWWGAVLPLDALRAVGSALPEAGEQALAELVLRAAAVGFRATVLVAPGPVPAPDPRGALLLALLHEPVGARTGLLAASLGAQLRALAGLRTDRAVRAHESLRALLHGPGAPAATAGPVRPAALPADAVRLHARLWLAWPALRRQWRTGALERASVAAWAVRSVEVDGGRPDAERGEDGGRPAGIRSPAWSTAERVTSAA